MATEAQRRANAKQDATRKRVALYVLPLPMIGVVIEFAP